MKRLEQDVTRGIRVKRLIESEDSHFLFSPVTRNRLKIREHLLPSACFSDTRERFIPRERSS